MKNNIAMTLILAVIVGVVGFFAGMKYQESKSGNFTTQQGGFNRGQGQMGQRGVTGVMGNIRGGFRPISGEIISTDDKSITVKLTDGSSKIVLFTDKTQINKAEQATSSDLKVGEKVAVFGTENAEGLVTAQNIQLNPTQNMGVGGRMPNGGPIGATGVNSNQ